MEFKEKFYSCECAGEVLRITTYDDYDTKEVCIAIFGLNNSNRMSMLHRIKYCIGVLFRGNYADDQIILSHDKAKDLSKFLNKTLKAWKQD